ncbi:hypothetical protein EYS14_05265 [Alteromonadaceae bacterium M269]|nr:hypothetical protein EYS14_05265 [Alteromonadaceae bacterium M269]
MNDSLNPWTANKNANACDESLVFDLSLTINGKKYTIPGANVKQCHIDAFSYGFTSQLGFYLPNDQRDDELITSFATEDLISVELQVKAVHNLPDPAPKALILKGLVTQKSVYEQAYRQVSGAPVLYRYYQISFADPARVLWKQHYPCELYVDDTFSTVINAQVVSPIDLTLDFSPLDEQKPLICLSLGNTETTHHGETGTTNQASFYDFLVDYLARNNGFLNYDYESNAYTISGDEAPLQAGTAFLPYEVTRIESRWPETPRTVMRLLNGTVDSSKQEEVDNSLAVDGIKHDVMLRHTIESRFTSRKDLESNKLRKQGQQLTAWLSQWPMQDFWPHKSFSMDKSADGSTFLHTSKTYRVNALSISAVALDDSPEHDVDLEYTQYRLVYKLSGHDSTSPQPALPKYQSPRYPLYVEGIIVSEQGEDDEKAFDVPSNDDTGQFEYKVNIPLWDLTIKVLLEPDFLNPHFYFPFYRNTKLLLGIDLLRAHVIRVLSWGEDVQLPMATQGNHILFGKNSEDQTSMSHVYEDGKPVLAIKRNKDVDTELVQLEEGSLILQTCEEE